MKRRQSRHFLVRTAEDVRARIAKLEREVEELENAIQLQQDLLQQQPVISPHATKPSSSSSSSSSSAPPICAVAGLDRAGEIASDALALIPAKTDPARGPAATGAYSSSNSMEELLGENASSVTGPATDVSAIELGVPIAIVNPVAITATASNPLNTTHGSMAIPSSISGDSLTGITRAGTTTSPPDVVAHSRRLLESTNGSFSPIGRGVPTAAAVEDDPEADEADAIEVDFEPPPHCVPIKANVLEFDWASLAAHCQFDVIMMDPPWQLASNAPTRGIALTYNQLPDAAIEDIPIASLQRNGGFVFVWVINNRYAKAFDMLKRWGYRFVDSIDWVKFTVNRRLAKCHGFYLQHAKETCLIGLKGDPPPGCVGNVASDVIFSERRGNSQKPDEMYELVEALVPNGKYLEIFGRRNNLRNYWVTIGNEL